MSFSVLFTNFAFVFYFRKNILSISITLANYIKLIRKQEKEGMSTSGGCNTSIFLRFIFINVFALGLFDHTGKTGRCIGFQNCTSAENRITPHLQKTAYQIKVDNWVLLLVFYFTSSELLSLYLSQKVLSD